MKIFSSRSLLVASVVFVFYTHIPLYLCAIKIPSIIPLYWIIFFGLVASFVIIPPFFLQHKIPKYFSKQVILWMIFYLLITLIWYIPSDHTKITAKVFRARILTVLFFSLILFILSGREYYQTLARWVILVSVFVAAANNLYEFLNPYAFVPMGSEYSNPGRSAGFYINANQSGAALVLGMIFTIGLLSPKYRSIYTFFVLLALFTTFSRSALLGWFIAVFSFIRIRILRLNSSFLIIVGVALFYFLLLPWVLNFIQNEKRVINVTNITERINWFSNPYYIEEASSKVRKHVAKVSWEMFANSPLWGNGIGTTDTWIEETSTHNIYLYFMADYGIIGAFIAPLFIASVVWKARGEARQIAIPFATFVFFWGIFNHNLVEEYYSLISFALMAAMSFQSQLSNDKLTQS